MNRSFKHLIKQYFNFSKKDRNAVIILSILILLVISANVIVDNTNLHSENDYTEFEILMEEWAEIESGRNFQHLFTFDPNTIAESKLDSLLLPDFVKRNLLSYRNAGGKIKSAVDLKKIYGMNDSIFSVVADYIEIGDEIFQTKKEDFSEGSNNQFEETDDFEKEQFFETVELNSVDSTDLVMLYGIGPVFASRIIKYRNLLGGFYSTDQLLEVYNFPEETYNDLKDQLLADTSKITKIRLNFAEFGELLRHPYLNTEEVSSIINYREDNGAFNSVEELEVKSIVSFDTYTKIKYYLSCR